MSSLIPDEAYLYWPSGDKVFTGSGKSLVRFIFYNTTFTDFENEMLLNFKSYLKSQGIESLPIFFSDEELLRTLLGCKFNQKKSLEAINSSISWRRSHMSNGYDALFPQIESLLNTGIIYIHGRDHRYRPLIVLNAGKLDLSNHSANDYCLLLCYLLEYTVKNLMTPGHIENWIIITDLNNQSIQNLPISEIKSIIKTLQDNFRCRMIVNYVVNAPRTLKFLWTVVKNFIEPHTVNKIRILREGKPQEMRNHFNPAQYEQKYGGTAPNATVFWPPVLPNVPFETEFEEAGAHLIQTKEAMVERRSEVFYSCQKQSFDEFFSLPGAHEESRHTVYHDAVEPTKEVDASDTMNLAENFEVSSQHLKSKNKKCCDRCETF